MAQKVRSIRPFLGSRDFTQSRSFYSDLGFEETELSYNLSVFKMGDLAFYLQDAYVADWVNNSMIFLEVEDVEKFWEYLQTLNLPSKYEGVSLGPIRTEEWGRECFLHDPSGILWHIGEFVR